MAFGGRLRVRAFRVFVCLRLWPVLQSRADFVWTREVYGQRRGFGHCQGLGENSDGLRPTCPLRSPANARSAARGATRTATIISAASSRCARSATTRATSSLTASCALIDQHDPLHLSIVGGEPLVRYRELDTILPQLAERGIYTQLVTSAVRPIPSEWAAIARLQVVVSIDGLQPEHDVRRTPATYDAS